MDHLLKQQHSRLLEIQQIQIDLLTELHTRRRPRKKEDNSIPGTTENLSSNYPGVA